MNNFQKYFTYEWDIVKKNNPEVTIVDLCAPEIYKILDIAAHEGWSGSVAPYYINSIKSYQISTEGDKSYADNEFVNKCVGELDEIYEKAKEFDEEHALCLLEYTLKVISNSMSFTPLSPLTFKDDEFSECYGTKQVQQNRRRSSVFKTDGQCYDIDAFKFNYPKKYDMESHQILDGYEFYCSGGICVYFEDEDQWKFLGRSVIKNRENYRSGLECEFHTIELIQPSDKRNDYFAHIINSKDIPNEYFEIYEPQYDTVKDSETKMVLTYLNNSEEIKNLIKYGNTHKA